MLSAMISADRAAEERANARQVSESDATSSTLPSEAKSGMKRRDDESVLPASKVLRLEESLPAVDTLLRFQESESSSEPTHIGTMIRECVQVGSEKVADFADTAVTFTKDVAEEMVTPGGVANKRAYEAGEISYAELTARVEKDNAEDIAAEGFGATFGGTTFGTAGALASGGSAAIPSRALGTAAGATTGYIVSKTSRAVRRTLERRNERATMGDGRKVDTKTKLDDFVEAKVQSHDFIKTHGTKSGKPTWKSGKGKKARYYQKSDEGWELEVYDKNGDHVGVLKSDGVFHPELKVEGRKINVR